MDKIVKPSPKVLLLWVKAGVIPIINPDVKYLRNCSFQRFLCPACYSQILPIHSSYHLLFGKILLIVKIRCG